MQLNLESYVVGVFQFNPLLQYLRIAGIPFVNWSCLNAGCGMMQPIHRQHPRVLETRQLLKKCNLYSRFYSNILYKNEPCTVVFTKFNCTDGSYLEIVAHEIFELIAWLKQ